MLRLRRLILITVFLVGVLAFLPATSAQQVAGWTFMMYMNADTNLEAPMMEDMYEIAQAGSSEGVNLLVQVDRIPDFDDQSFGGWTDTRRYYVTSDTRYEDDALVELGEANMGDGATLEDFLDWSITNFPAEHYMLVLSNHGGGWLGLGPDETDPPGTLSLAELHNVLTDVRERHGIDKFDIVAFDACLMSQIDVLVALEPHADYTLASAELVPGAGFEYTTPLRLLNKHPDMTPQELGTAFIDSFMDYHGQFDDKSFELYLMDLSFVPTLLETMDDFIGAVEDSPSESIGYMGVARINAQRFGGSDFEFIDAIHFMQQIVGQYPPDDVAQAAQAFIDTATAMTVYGRSAEGLPNSRGLSIYFPLNAKTYNEYGFAEAYGELSPPTMAKWREFIGVFHSTAEEITAANRVKLDVLDVLTWNGEAGSILNPPVLIFDVSGSAIVGWDFIAEYLFDDGTRLLLVEYPIAFFTVNAAGDQIASYPDGLLRTEFVWDARYTTISDGEQTIPILLRWPNALASTVYTEGVYYAYQDGEPIWSGPARLVFDFNTEKLIRVWGQEEGEYGLTEFEIAPSAGDIFSPNLYVVGEDGETTAVEAEPFITFTGNMSDIFYTWVPGDTGTYRTSIRVSDLAGSIAFDSIEVDINNDDIDANFDTYRSLQSGLSFAHPVTWTSYDYDDPTTGETYTYFVDPNGDAALYLPFYEVDSFDALTDELLATVEGYDYDIGKPFVINEAYDAVRVDFTFPDAEDESQTLTATYLAVYSAEQKGGYIFQFILREPVADQMDFYVDLFMSNLLLIEPLNLDEMQF